MSETETVGINDASSASVPRKVGTLLRFSPLTIWDLPTPSNWNKESKYGPAKDSNYWDEEYANVRPSLQAFIESVLAEARMFINCPGAFPLKGEMISSPAAGKVSKHKTGVTTQQLQDLDWKKSICTTRRRGESKLTAEETWVGRCSRHRSAAEDGTASWEEFKEGILYDHSQNEMNYTHTIKDCRVIIDWSDQIKDIAFSDGLTDIGMKVVEMFHEMPKPLNPRVFSTLVVTGMVTPDRIMVAQIPVDINSLPETIYSNGANLRPQELCFGDNVIKKKVVQGMYTSIEQCTRVGDETVWSMVTSSDAGGALPRWVQGLKILDAIVADVGFFVGWRQRVRENAAESIGSPSVSNEADGTSGANADKRNAPTPA